VVLLVLPKNGRKQNDTASIEKHVSKSEREGLRAVMKDLEKCRGKNISTEEPADWIGKLVTAHIIEEALRITEDDSKPSQVGDESSFAIVEGSDEGNN